MILKPSKCYSGSIFTDFKPQIETLNRDKYTIVAWDPPGYGFSRPPDRDFSPGFFYRDAECAISLMKVFKLSCFHFVIILSCVLIYLGITIQ